VRRGLPHAQNDRHEWDGSVDRCVEQKVEAIQTHLGRLGVNVTSLTMLLLLHMLNLLPHACVVSSKVLNGRMWAVLRLLLQGLLLLGLHECRVEVGQHRILRKTFCHLLSGWRVRRQSRCLSRAAGEPHRAQVS
jgi:hypothetical protein